MDYGRAIRLVRGARNLSQTELAEKLAVDRSIVSYWESGNRTPSAEMQQRLAKALELPLYLLILVASDQDELTGVPAEKAQLFGLELLRLMAGDSRDDIAERG
jgi:transcriptional regulator with XRE-family HTH domain